MIGRVRERRTFEALRRDGHRARRGPVALTYLPHQSRPTAGRSTENRSAGGTACVAFALGRDIGGAVARNRLRRRLRAVCHDLDRAGELPPGAYLLRAGRPASELSFGDLARCVAQNVSAATTAST